MLGTTQAHVLQNRITATGFILGLAALTSGFILNQRGSTEIEVLSTAFISFVPLFLAFVLSLLALSLFLWAGQLDPKGTATTMPVGLGEITLFIAMAQLLEGGLKHLLFELNETLTDIPLLQGGQSGEMVSVGQLSATLTWCLGLLAGCAWVWLIYVLPVRVLFRETFSRFSRLGLGLFFVVVLGIVLFAGAQAERILASSQGADPGLWAAFSQQALLPLELLE
jgi:hypothetical protein